MKYTLSTNNEYTPLSKSECMKKAHIKARFLVKFFKCSYKDALAQGMKEWMKYQSNKWRVDYKKKQEEIGRMYNKPSRVKANFTGD